MDPVSADWNQVAETALRYGQTPRSLDARLQRVLDRRRGPAVGSALVLPGVVGALLLGVAVAVHVVLALTWWLVVAAAFLAVLLVVLAFAREAVTRRSARRRCEDALVNAPLYVGHVVRGHLGLLEAGDRRLRALVVFTKDRSRTLEYAFGRALAERVGALQGQPNPGGDLAPLWHAIHGDEPQVRVRLPASLGVDGDAYLYAIDIDQGLLPSRRLGHSRALPFLLSRDEVAVYVF